VARARARSRLLFILLMIKPRCAEQFAWRLEAGAGLLFSAGDRLHPVVSTCSTLPTHGKYMEHNTIILLTRRVWGELPMRARDSCRRVLSAATACSLTHASATQMALKICVFWVNYLRLNDYSMSHVTVHSFYASNAAIRQLRHCFPAWRKPTLA